jgi:hypothetical protein
MPIAVRASSGAGVIIPAATRDPQPKSSTAPRPRTENGHPRRNSTSNHKRPSSAPGDDNVKPNGAHVVDLPPARDRPKKPPLTRSKSDHPSRGLRLDTSTDSSNDELTAVAAEDFGTRHGFDGHYQSEDIISQLANVGDPSSVASRCGLGAGQLVASLTSVSAPPRQARAPRLARQLHVVCTGALSQPCGSSLPCLMMRSIHGFRASWVEQRLCAISRPTGGLESPHPTWNLRSRHR